MSKLPTLLEMLKAGVHFGHQTSRWHPKMDKYIFGVRNGIHIIDLESTLVQLQKAMDYAKTLASTGKVILFVGTKHQARGIIKEAAESCNMPYLTERWIGGLLTNFSEVKRRLKMYRDLKEQFESGEIEKYSKKERLQLKKKLEKMDKYLIGLTSLTALPDALYISDLRCEKTAVVESMRTDIPVMAAADTNVNPDKAKIVVPANDDAINSTKMMSDLMASAIKEGVDIWEKKKFELKVKEDKNKIEIKEKKKRALTKEAV